MSTLPFYCDGMPSFLKEIADTAVMRRLRNVGMNCGVEYTRFPLFRKIAPYSRYDHSLGTGMITWRFTGDRAASAAALLHDVATPVFAHTVDFMNGDHERQESTETRTASVIAGSRELGAILDKYGLTAYDVSDYHRYPVADNDTPKLAADRLEYTLGNMVNFGFADVREAARLYGDLTVGKNEYGEPELMFHTPETAESFTLLAMKCARVYVSPEDRYAMQRLSELLKTAVERGVIALSDLETDEPAVIRKLTADETTGAEWENYRRLSCMADPAEYPENARVIPAKKRRIDPFVKDRGRVSALSGAFRKEMDAFMDEDLLSPVCGIQMTDAGCSG